MFRRLVLCVCGCFAAIACFLVNPTLAGLEVLVASGDASPDGNGTFSVFGNTSLNDAGQVAFISSLADTTGGQADANGVFRSNGAGVTQIVRFGESFQGNPVIGFFPLNLYIDRTGDVVGQLATGPPTTFFLFRGDGGLPDNLFPSGSPSPTGNNELLGVLSQVVNDDGTIVYWAVYGGTNQETGLYELTPDGMLTTRLLRGSAAPRGGIFDATGARYTLNESKQIATVGSVLENEETFGSLIRINTSSTEEFVREGDLLADAMTSIVDFGARVPIINESGAIAFAAEYEQPGIRSEGVFIADSGAASLIAGRLLPGGPAAATDIEIFGFSDAQQIAFSAEVGIGLNPTKAIYTADASEVSLIAIEETSAPGTDKLFKGFPFASATSNSSGELAFLADLADTKNGATTGRALFRYTESEGLAPIVQTGDSLNGSTVEQIFYAGTLPNSTSHLPDASLNGMNAAGQIAFVFELADGQFGIALWSPNDNAGDFDDDGDVDGDDFLTWQRGGSPNPLSGDDLANWQSKFGDPPALVADSTAVPEPSALLLLIVGGTPLLAQRRRS